jgi:hypothetical protein
MSKKIIEKSKFTYEKLLTDVMEAIINSRPLSLGYVFTDGLKESLTSWIIAQVFHTSITDLLEIRECRRQQRQTKRSARINVGDIVVIHEDEKHFGN